MLGVPSARAARLAATPVRLSGDPGATTRMTDIESAPAALAELAPRAHAEVQAALAFFGVDEELIARTLALALEGGADFADLYFQHQRTTSASREDGLVHRASSRVDRGVGIRAVRGDQTGYAYCEELTPEALFGAARTASSIAAHAAPGARPAPAAFARPAGHELYPQIEAWGAVDVERQLPLLGALEERVRARASGIEKVSVEWSSSEERVLVATSEGILRADRRPMARLGVTLTASRGGAVQTGTANAAGRRGIEWFDAARLDEIAERAVLRTLILFDARRPPAGEMPVVLARGASGILLHEAIGHGMEADFNRKRASIYTTLLDQRVARECVTIVDSGLLEHERGALNFDDEGELAQHTVLVENGILRSYLHDRISAAHYGVAPTGSGRRESFRDAPMPRMRCTWMAAGPHEREEIVRSVKRGILAESFRNGQVQIGAGDFTFYLQNGWLIEDGRITAPIKDVNIIGNGPAALRAISMVAGDLEIDVGGWTCGKEGQSVPVSQGMPTALVDRLTVGGIDA